MPIAKDAGSRPSQGVAATTRVLLTEEPYLPQISRCSWLEHGIWPCSWVAAPSGVSAFRLRVNLPEKIVVRVHVTADEGYELYVDGTRLGRGPERGDPRNWFFETYDIPLEAGEHTIVARVWVLGSASMRSQMSLAPGFLFSPDDDNHISLFGTGVANWEFKTLSGHEFFPPFPHNFFSVGHGLRVQGDACDWGWPTGEGEGWEKAEILHPGSSATFRNRYAPTVHLLRPATLPPMQETTRNFGKVRAISTVADGAIREGQDLPGELEGWTKLFSEGVPLEIAPNTCRRVILDLEDYVCAYPQVRLSGGDGGSFQVFWAESLFHEPEARTKGNRHEIEGKYFVGYGDRFCPAGPIARDYESFHWRAGRYLEILVQTASEPLKIEKCSLLTTRYPLETCAIFSSADPSLEAIMPLGLKALTSSSHDAYIDGPYYEQMMWLGDAVQNSLSTYALTRDDKLVRKLLRLFDSSRVPSGLTAARWPARDTLVIAPYSLLWINILRDYVLWKEDKAFVQSLLPGMRAILHAFLGFLDSRGLMRPAMGWNFIDWVPGWSAGAPPGTDDSPSGILNWQLVRTLGYAAELEEAVGEPELAKWARRRAEELAKTVETYFWDSKRGLFADDLEKTRFSEHAQAEAILSGEVSPDKLEVLRRTLFEDQDMARTTISYTHYLFEAYRKLGRVDVLLQRLDLWRNLPALGLYTTPEGPEPTRSDCHAWGAHVLYHFFASILGIRPASPGFSTVELAPQLGGLAWAKGVLPHPRGEIKVELEASETGSVRGRVTLPEGITGTLVLRGETVSLDPGLTEF